MNSKKNYLLVLVMVICFVSVATAQKKKASNPEDEIRKYWFVMLMKGPKRDHDSATAAKIQTAHLNNINRLYNEGKIKVAGPFGANDKWLGIFIFDCATKEEVEQLLKTDEAVSSGRLSYEIQPWYTAPTGSFTPGIPKKKY